MLKAVLFDLDGTLLDRRATFERHLQIMVDRHPDVFGLELRPYLLRRLVDLDQNGFEARPLFYRRVEELLGLEEGSGDVLHDYFEANFPEVCVPMPNLSKTLEVLGARGYRIGLITNGRELIQSRKLDGLGIRSHLEVEVISETVGIRKPNPGIFEIALDAFGISAAEAAYVGDNPAPDVVGAHRSGLVPVWRRDKFFDVPAEAELIIDDLAELLDHFEGVEA